MSGGTRENRGNTPGPFCFLPVNNFNIGRHLRVIHNFGDAGSQTPRSESSSSSAQWDDSDSDECNDIECTYRANESGANELASSSADSGDSENDESNDSEDSNKSAEDEKDEAEKTVEDYIREITDETLRTDITYDPKRVLKYLSWARRTPLTPIEYEAIRFLRCASFGHGSSKARANEWLAYQRAFDGQAALLPKSIDTVWSVMAAAQGNMSDAIMRKTVVLAIPIEVLYTYISHVHFTLL
jgi:hypothetical protein